MTVGELIKLLEKMPSNMEVAYDYEGNSSTVGISEVYIGNKLHNPENKKIVVIE